MKKGIKKLISIGLCLTLMFGVSGCSSKEKESAMGRYIEERYEIPQSGYIQDMVKLDNGNIAMIGSDEIGKIIYYTSTDDGANWENKSIELPKEEGKETIAGQSSILKNGEVLLSYFFMEPIENVEGDKEVMDKEIYVQPEMKYVVIDSDGILTEKTINFPEEEESEGMWKGQASMFKSADNGDILYVASSGNSVVQIDSKSLEEKNRYQSDDYVESFILVGNSLFTWGFTGIMEYDLESGKEKGKLEALEKETINSNKSYNSRMINSGSKDKIYYYSVLGLFSYDIKSSETKMLIDGSLSDFGNQQSSLIGFIERDNGEFLALFNDWNNEGASFNLINYSYSADTPSEPDKKLTIYSLTENDTVRQVMSAYSRENKDTYVKYEVGLSFEEGVTEADALKTLNTEIMAGNGPDIILLDGLPIESYIEKGLLEDISDVISEYIKGDLLFKNMEEAYNKDGKIYQFPTGFKLPMLVGDKANIDRVTDYKSLVDLTKELGKSSDNRIISEFYSPKSLVYSLYYLYGNSWLNENNTINEENLLEFFTNSKEMYTAINENNEKYMKKIEEMYKKENEANIEEGIFIDKGGIDLDGEEGGKLEQEQDDFMNLQELNYSLSPSAYVDQLMFDEDPASLIFGGLEDEHSLSSLVTVLNNDANINYKILTRDDENIFIPIDLIGVNAKGENKESAKDFLKQILSEEVQSSGLFRRGLPVNKAALGKKFEMQTSEEYKPEYDEATKHYIRGTMGSSGPDGVMKEVKQLWPNETDVNRLMVEIEKVNVAPTLNKTLLLEVAKQFDIYVQDEVTVDEAIETIVKNLDIYLAE